VLSQGLGKTFSAYAAPDVRLYRHGGIPFIGREESSEAIAKTKGQVTWQPIASDTSSAGDLGYTHGTYDVADDTKKVIEHGSYVRIWKKQGATWQIIMDVTNVH
jgi:hypothetical protein